MSDFMDMLVEMLPMHSSLQNEVNPVRQVLDKSMGEYMEAFEQPFDQLFLESASGGWLDAFGRDFGVPRKLEEDDDTYRQRIVYEKKDNLTVGLLMNVYNVDLFCAYDGFNPTENMLTSDNPYICNFLLGVTDNETINILDNKFVMDNNIIWYTGDELDYIINTSNQGVLKNYLSLYNLEETGAYFMGADKLIKSAKLTLRQCKNIKNFFYQNTNLISVDLTLPRAVIGSYPFYGCTNLTSINIDAPFLEDVSSFVMACTSLASINFSFPSAKNCKWMLYGCTSLTSVVLDLPSLDEFTDIFKNSPNLESIVVTIPDGKVTSFKSYVLGLELTDLTSFIVNGEEVDLT